jgi:hypothetical protein
MCHTGIQSFVVDQYIIKKDKDKMAWKESKHFVHKALKSERCITKTERHHQEPTMAFMCVKSSFLGIYQLLSFEFGYNWNEDKD